MKYPDEQSLELLFQLERMYMSLWKKLNVSKAPKSDETLHDYFTLGQILIEKARKTSGGLIAVLAATERTSTYFSRVAALNYYCTWRGGELLKSLNEFASTGEAFELLIAKFELNIELVHDLLTARENGPPAIRLPRCSKRRSLTGLPQNWREMVCELGSGGKYADALLVTALTGCRPAELTKGVTVALTRDDLTGVTSLQFNVVGAKVREGQGQPERRLTLMPFYEQALSDMLIERTLKERSTATVVIDSPGNFCKEMTRISKKIWPNHPSNVTPYCFRHQWSANAKRRGCDPDVISRGLGHQSSKSRKHYGRAKAGSPGHRSGLTVDATFPIKQVLGHRNTRPKELISSSGLTK